MNISVFSGVAECPPKQGGCIPCIRGLTKFWLDIGSKWLERRLRSEEWWRLSLLMRRCLLLSSYEVS